MSDSIRTAKGGRGGAQRSEARRRAAELARIPVLCCCSVDDLTTLPCESFSFHPKQLVYARAQPATHVYLLVSGRIRSYHVVDGSERTTTLLDGPGTFGEIEALSEAAGGEPLGYVAHVEAVTPCRGWRVSAASFVAWLRVHHASTTLLLGDVCRRSCSAATRELSAFVDVGVRIASLLLEVVDGLPKRQGTDRSPVRVHLTAQAIAHHLGITERSVTRTFAVLKSKGWIRHAKGWLVIVDRDALEVLCGGLRFRLVYPLQRNDQALGR